MKLLQTKCWDVEVAFTICKGEGGFAFPLDLDWSYGGLFVGNHFAVTIYFLCWKMLIYWYKE